MTGRILIVDDNPIMGGLLKDFLESRGYEVLHMESPVEALSKIEAESFNMVIMDYSMPDMTGIELTRLIRQIKPSLPIIGMSMHSVGKYFIEAGADRFMFKPFELKELKDVVDNYLKAGG